MYSKAFTVYSFVLQNYTFCKLLFKDIVYYILIERLLFIRITRKPRDI